MTQSFRFLHIIPTDILGFFITFFFFLADCAVCRILVSQPGIEPVPPAVEAQSPNHWTSREFPFLLLLKGVFKEIKLFAVSLGRLNWTGNSISWGFSKIKIGNFKCLRKYSKVSINSLKTWNLIPTERCCVSVFFRYVFSLHVGIFCSLTLKRWFTWHQLWHFLALGVPWWQP